MRTPSVGKPARKASSVRPTRAIQRDRRRHPPSAPPAVEITVRLTELVYPAALNTLGEFRCRGLRERVLTLPVMVALVLALIWRQLSGVAELVRLVQQELVFWVPPLRVSAQALESRLRCLLGPAVPPGLRSGAAPAPCRVAALPAARADGHRLGARPLQPGPGL